jgi:DNA-binding CsgD family transcriptional regulator
MTKPHSSSRTSSGADMSPFAMQLIAGFFEATSPTDLQNRLQQVAWCLGFDHSLFGMQLGSLAGAYPAQFVLNGYPMTWRATYVKKNYIKVDPTVAHCQTQTAPLIWSEALITKENRAMWQDARASGLRYGLSIPHHEHGGLKSMLSLARDRPIESNEAVHLVKAARVVACALHFAALPIAVPYLKDQTRAILTSSEMEILRMAAKGLATPAIAVEMNITPRTVGFHMNKLLRKLNCRNRIEVIAKASALGLL